MGTVTAVVFNQALAVTAEMSSTFHGAPPSISSLGFGVGQGE